MYCNFSSKRSYFIIGFAGQLPVKQFKKMESILLDAARDRKMQVDLEWKLSFSTWDYYN